MQVTGIEKVTGSVIRQIRFLILLVLHDDPDHQRRGINLNNLKADLGENGILWKTVGLPIEGKDFPKTLNWQLSNLKREQSLRPAPQGRTKQGKFFDQALKESVSELTEYLELEIDFGDTMMAGRSLIVKRIGDGTIGYRALSSVVRRQDPSVEKKMNLLTTEQMTRLAQLSVELGCY